MKTDRTLHPVLLVLVLGACPGSGAYAQRLLFDDLGRMLPVEYERTMDMALCGRELVIAKKGQNRLYTSDGTGIFSDVTAGRLPVDQDESTAVAVGDFDRDGDLDLLFGNGGQQQQNRLYLNNGAGVFTDATAACLPAVARNTMSLAIGDVDGDGDLDVLEGNLGPNGLYLNNGAGVFADASQNNLPALDEWTQDVALEDLDGDGDLDAVCGNYLSTRSRLYLNNGAGVFTDASAARLPQDYGRTRALALGDVDGDGDLDIMFGRVEQNALCLNDGSGFFSDATGSLPVHLHHAMALSLGDLDGDGDLDALVGNVVENRLDLYFNDGSGVFADASATHLPGLVDATCSIAMGDLDGDGDLDVLIGNDGEDRLYLNDGSGRLTGATHRKNLPPASGTTQVFVMGDLDGDGDLDALSGRDGQNRLFLNDGAGNFIDVTLTHLPPSVDNTRSIALGDVDGDGDLDALVGSCSPAGGQNRLLLNNGRGVFIDATATNLPLDLDCTEAVALGDVDGDGDLDAYLGNTGQDRLYLNDGAGLFRDHTLANLPGDSDPASDLALGDVDGDGDLDAFVLCDNFGNRLNLNDGTGVFTDVTSSRLPQTSGIFTSLAMGDVDGDGDLDFLIGKKGWIGTYPDPHQNLLLLNDGYGTFTDAAANLPQVLDYTLAVALSDVDGDGSLDALIGDGDFYSWLGNNDCGPLLYLNDGAGHFSDATALCLPPHQVLDVVEIALGDVDGDRDPDLFLGGPERLYANLQQQLAWRAIPRIGKGLTLEVHGSPSASWALFAAAGTARIPTSIGTLMLDPLSLANVHSAVLDPQGRQSFILPVPADPGLVGQSVYWQGVVTSPLSLTNLEITTFTNL